VANEEARRLASPCLPTATVGVGTASPTTAFACIFIIISFIYFHKFYSYLFIFIKLYLYLYSHVAILNGKWKPRRFSLIRFPFAHRANGGLICPFVDEEANRSYPATPHTEDNISNISTR
jgi:hypothetical protein